MKKIHLAMIITLVVGLVGCDHGTKRLARAQLQDRNEHTLISGIVDLRYTENDSASFSMLRSVPAEIRVPLLRGLGLLAIPFLIFFWYRRRDAHWSEQLALALFLAGALGNLIDRLILGHVIDFIHVHHWPIFNVADICITAGAILFFIVALRTKPPQTAPT